MAGRRLCPPEPTLREPPCQGFKDSVPSVVRVNLEQGVSLHCDVFGRPEAAPVLYAHGSYVSGEMWKEAAEGLDGETWRSIVPDLRGHGRSSVSDSVTIADFADDCAALLDALGERRPVVFVGLSMGGIIAFEFFRRHRRRLRALVLVDTRPTPETPEGAIAREQLAQDALARGSRAAADALIDLAFAPDAPASLKSRWRNVIETTPPRGVAATARALATRADSRPTLPAIDVPTLIVVGEKDQITPVGIAQEMHAAIPGSRLDITPGAGHMTPVEQPGAFQRTLAAFLDSLPPLT